MVLAVLFLQCTQELLSLLEASCKTSLLAILNMISSPISIILNFQGRKDITTLLIGECVVLLIPVLYLLPYQSQKSVPGCCLYLILSKLLVSENTIYIVIPLSFFLRGERNWARSYISLTCYAYCVMPTL